MKTAHKKVWAMLLALTMMLSVLAGCGGQPSGTQTTPPADGSQQPAGESGAPAEVKKIYMTFITKGVDPTDLNLVQDAINEISVPEIGVEVEFKPVSVFDAPSTCTRWIAGGEQLDLMAVAFTGLKPYIDQGMIMSLNDLIAANGPYLQELSERAPLYDPTVAGTVYGCMAVPMPMGMGGAYMIMADDLAAAGLSYQDGDKITLDDLDEIFAAVKAAKPDTYPCGIFGSLPCSSYNILYDSLGATTASGVTIGLESTEVVNLFTTDEYKDYLEHVRGWYENGYIMKEAATAEANLTDYQRSGAISGNYNNGSATLLVQAAQTVGKDFVRLVLEEPFQPAVSASQNTFWTVPVTSKEPEAAVRFMNLMFKDSRIMNLFCWGIEGKHYVVTSEENMEIDYPEGVTAADVGYSALGFYGDQNIMYQMGTNPLQENTEWAKIVETRNTVGCGFCYDSSAMTNQIIAVEAVISEYLPALETGSADLDTAYPEFVAKLEANGINDIIADKQAQFNDWLAQQ